jgi:hypothetical protein
VSEDLRAAVAAGVLGSEEGHRALLQSIVEVARAIFKAKASSIFLLDEAADELVFEAVAGEGSDALIGKRFPSSTGIAGFVLVSRQPLVIEDVVADPRFAREAAEGTGFVPKGLMAVPLLHEERALGVLEVLDRPRDSKFSLAEMELLGLFANQAATGNFWPSALSLSETSAIFLNPSLALVSETSTRTSLAPRFSPSVLPVSNSNRLSRLRSAISTTVTAGVSAFSGLAQPVPACPSSMYMADQPPPYSCGACTISAPPANDTRLASGTAGAAGGGAAGKDVVWKNGEAKIRIKALRRIRLSLARGMTERYRICLLATG